MTSPQDDHERTDRYGDEEFENRPVSLAPLFQTVWLYRQIIAAAVAGILLLTLVGLVGVMVWTGGERIGTVPFRVMFDGAEKGTYPNGLPFSTAEIVAAPVLTEVFEKNELKQYGRYEHFKDAVSILQANEAIQLLTLEYQAKLSETRLTAAERTRLEDEFRRKRESLRDPQYSLNLRRRERFRAMPNPLVEKVLTDILDTWAQQAAERRGAVRYNIPTFSRNILQLDTLLSEDYTIGVDIVRSKVDRILRSVDQIASIPGAQVIRVGENRISLPEVRAGLEDIVRFNLQPLLAFIRASALSKDPRSLSSYVETQLFQIRLSREQAASGVLRLQEALRDYVLQRGGLTMTDRGPAGGTGGSSAQPGGVGALMPQLGESFLDRLVELSTQNNDIQYRQDLTDRIIRESVVVAILDKELAYYAELSRSVKGIGAGAGSASRTAAETVTRRLKEAMAGITTAVDQLNAIYEEISKHNLNPSTLLYAKTRPFTVRTVRAIGLRSAALVLLLVFLLSVVLVPIACLIHHYFLREVVGRLSFPRKGAGA